MFLHQSVLQRARHLPTGCCMILGHTFWVRSAVLAPLLHEGPCWAVVDPSRGNLHK